MELEKVMNILFKKYPRSKFYKDDLTQDAYVFVEEAKLLFDASKNKTLDEWITLYVYNKLRNKFKTFYSKKVKIFNAQSAMSISNLENIECVIDLLAHLTEKDKVVLIEKIVNSTPVKIISKQYNIPIRDIYTVEKNLQNLFKYGDF